jgi:hypothetical protein
MENTISEISRNLTFPLADAEAVRRESIRLSLLRDKELSSKSFKDSLNNQKIDNSLVSSALSKLELLIDHNQRNNTRIGITKDIPSSNVRALTDKEVEAIIKKN